MLYVWKKVDTICDSNDQHKLRIPTTALILRENFPSQIKTLPMQRRGKKKKNCNRNDEIFLHKLKTGLGSSKNRKLNFHLAIKLTVNSSWFRLTLCEPKLNNLKSKWSRELPQAQGSTTAFIDGEKFAAWNIILPVHHDCNPNDQANSHKLKIRAAS